MKQNQAGIAHVAILVGIVLSIIGATGYYVYSKNKTNNSADNRQSVVDEPVSTQAQSEHSAHMTRADDSKLIIHNFGIDTLSNVDVTNDAVREYSSNGFKGFYAFGDVLGGGGNRRNPNFEFASVKPGTKAVAAIDGVIGFVREQTATGDYEVFLQPKENSMWTIGYDHIKNPTVKQGDIVKIGDVLGEPAPQQNGALRFEVQINKDENGQTTHICPTTLLANEISAALTAELETMLQNWETTTKLELYDIAAQQPVGCLEQTLTPAQAEGR